MRGVSWPCTSIVGWSRQGHRNCMGYPSSNMLESFYIGQASMWLCLSPNTVLASSPIGEWGKNRKVHQGFAWLPIPGHQGLALQPCDSWPPGRRRQAARFGISLQGRVEVTHLPGWTMEDSGCSISVNQGHTCWLQTVSLLGAATVAQWESQFPYLSFPVTDLEDHGRGPT